MFWMSIAFQEKIILDCLAIKMEKHTNTQTKKISQKFIVLLFFSFLFSVSNTILIAKSKFLQENSGRF